MGRTNIVVHADREIVFMDFTCLSSPDEALAAIAEARAFVAAQPRRRSLLTLVDVTNAKQDNRVIEALKELAEHDKPWVLAGAVVGISPLWRMLFKVVTMFSGRKLASFANAHDAKEWLVRQWVPPASVPDVSR
jgi:hypothetical protein